MSNQFLVDIVVSIVASIASGVVITLFVEAFRKPYPINRLDYYIRGHFKKGNIKGRKLVYQTDIEVDCEDEGDVLNYLRGDLKYGEFKNLIDVHLNGINIGDLSFDGRSITGRMNTGENTGELKLLVYKDDKDYDPTLVEDKVKLKFSAAFNNWRYKEVWDLLHDIKTYKEEVLKYLGMNYHYSEYNSVVDFETNREPLVLNYLNKASKLNNNINIKLDNDVYIKFIGKHCEFIGVKTTSDFREILKAIIWYV